MIMVNNYKNILSIYVLQYPRGEDERRRKSSKLEWDQWADELARLGTKIDSIEDALSTKPHKKL